MRPGPGCWRWKRSDDRSPSSQRPTRDSSGDTGEVIAVSFAADPPFCHPERGAFEAPTRDPFDSLRSLRTSLGGGSWKRASTHPPRLVLSEANGSLVVGLLGMIMVGRLRSLGRTWWGLRQQSAVRMLAPLKSLADQLRTTGLPMLPPPLSKLNGPLAASKLSSRGRTRWSPARPIAPVRMPSMINRTASKV